MIYNAVFPFLLSQESTGASIGLLRPGFPAAHGSATLI
jgi:hypothetical protein